VGIVLKELRETHINLCLLANLEEDPANKSLFANLIKESDELLAIFHKTVMTAKLNAGVDS
jgi:hypothetical protein